MLRGSAGDRRSRHQRDRDGLKWGRRDQDDQSDVTSVSGRSNSTSPTPVSGPASVASARGWSIAIVLVVIAIWGGARGGTYTLDSVPLVRENPSLQTFDVKTIFTGDWWASAGQPGGLYRPLAGLWLATLLKVGGGAASTILLGSVLLQAFTAVMRFLLFRRILEGRPRGETAAAFIALVSCLHPVAAEAIGSPVGAADLLAVAFESIALWILAVGVGWKASVGIVVASACAVLSKESAVALPAAACAVAVLMPSEASNLRATVARAIGLSLVGVFVALALRVSVLGMVGAGDPVHAGFSTSARMASAMAVFATSTLPMLFDVNYLLAVVGHADALPASGWSDPRAFLGVAIVGLSLGCAYFVSSRGRPLWFWGVLTFLAFLLPVSNLLVPTGAVTASRFLIPALPWIALPLFADLFGTHRRLGQEGGGVGVLLAILVTAVAAFFSAREIAVWRNDATLFATERARSATSIHAAYNLGVAKFVQSPAEAREHFKAAIDTPVVMVPGTAVPIEDLEELRFQATMNLGKIEIESRRDVISARAAFDRAVDLCKTMRASAAPWHTTSWRDQLSSAYRTRSSSSLYAMALETSAEARSAFVGDAAADLESASQINPNNPDLLDSKARLALMKGDKDGFATLAARMASEYPDSPATWSIQALKLRRDGKINEALVFEAKSALQNLMNAAPEQLLTIGTACVTSKDATLVRQGIEILRAGLARSQGNPNLARAAGEATQALREALGGGANPAQGR